MQSQCGARWLNIPCATASLCLFQHKYLEGLFTWCIWWFPWQNRNCDVAQHQGNPAFSYCVLWTGELSQAKRRDIQVIQMFQREDTDTVIRLCQGFLLKIEASAQRAEESMWENEIALRGIYQLPGNSCPKLLLSLMRHFNNPALEAFLPLPLVHHHSQPLLSSASSVNVSLAKGKFPIYATPPTKGKKILCIKDFFFQMFYSLSLSFTLDWVYLVVTEKKKNVCRVAFLSCTRYDTAGIIFFPI